MGKLQIRKLGVLSVAKMYAIMMFVIMLIISIPYGLIMIGISLMGASAVRGNDAFAVGGMGVVSGVAIMIILPIIYAVLGFIFGAIGALIYNVFAGIVGGIEIEVDEVY